MTHMEAIVSLIVGILTIIGIVGAFAIALLRRFWSLEQFIKTSIELDKTFKKSDRKLKKELQKLVENKYADHIQFDRRLQEVEMKVDAIYQGKRRRELRRQEQGYRQNSRHTRTA